MQHPKGYLNSFPEDSELVTTAPSRDRIVCSEISKCDGQNLSETWVDSAGHR